MSETYLETFDKDAGGFFGWVSNAGGAKPLEHRPGSVTFRSPWWIDYNHAPPGAGYLHMLCVFNTRGPEPESIRDVSGFNTFIAEKRSTNFTNARITLRLRGELETRGAEMLFLIQGTVGTTCSGWLLTGQPFKVTPDWSEQTITAVPDPAQWKCLGSRHDRCDYYGFLPLETVLSDVNTDFLFVLFPLDVAPMGQISGDPHILRADRDYPVWRSRLPEGYIEVDTFRIDYA